MKPEPIVLPQSRPRRVRGAGRIFHKGNNRTWTIQYYVEGFKKKNGQTVLDGNGRPVRARVAVREATGTASETAAQKILTKRLNESSRGEWVERERRPATVEELFDDMREDCLIAHREEAAARLGWQWEKHLKPVFANVVADRLTTAHVSHYKRKRQKEGAADATINRELGALRRMLSLGRECDPKKVQKVFRIKMLKEENVRTGFVEDADFSRLAAEASELWLRTFLELGFTYGWRKGELLGLRVRQVNLPNRTIRLDHGTTKNGEGREVMMTAKVAELLRQAVAGKGPDDFVLTRKIEQGGRTVNRPVRSLRAAWRNLCLRAGLGEFVCRKCERAAPNRKQCECGGRGRKYRGLIPHDLRRSAAKAARLAGVAESVIMDTGGWKTAAMFRRYDIKSRRDQQAYVEALEKSRAAENGARSGPVLGETAPTPVEARSAKVN
jgi:integrase